MSEELTLKWERLEDTRLMNCPNILAVDDWGVYHLGKLVNGKFYELDYRYINRHCEIEIIKYVELPERE